MSLVFLLAGTIGIKTNSYITISGWQILPHTFPGYDNIYYFTQTAYSSNFFRNSGIFVEPSMFAYVITIAMLLELFLNDSNKVLTIKRSVFIVTILSTMSTTCIIMMILAYSYYIYINYKKARFFFALSIPILMLLIILLISSKMQNTFSYGSRTDDLIAGILDWKDHIIFGNGLYNNASFIKYIQPYRILTGFSGTTTGLLQVLAYGGIYFFLYYLIPTIMGMVTNKKIAAIALFSFLTCIFVTSQDFYIYIVILSFLVSAYYANKVNYRRED